MVRYEKEILDYVRNHPGCSRSDIGAAIGDPKAEHEVDQMVEDGRLERWYSGMRPHYHIFGTYTPYPPPHLKEPSKKHEKAGNKYITSYLDLFDEFCDEVRGRYEDDVLRELTPEAMISLYRGFIAYMAG